MKLFKHLILILLALGVLCFALLEALILLGGRDDADRDVPVMIVLGAMVWPGGPSPVLECRLDKALAYWQAHPDVVIIVSGGQGADEPESEAKAMFDYLVMKGVPAQSIHMEDRSTSTAENLVNSRALMTELGFDPDNTPVVVVSNSFHLTRVRMLCNRYGLDADTLGAPMPDRRSALKSYTREVFALVKSFLLD